MNMGFSVRPQPLWIAVVFVSVLLLFAPLMLPGASAQTPDPAITTVADSDVDHDSAKITVTVSSANNTTIYLQHKKRSDTSWPATNTAQQLTATSSSPSPSHTYSGLDASTLYDVRASLESDFSSGVVTDDFTTSAPPPAITTVAYSDVTHNSAKITVTVSNPNSTTVYLQYKKTADPSFTSVPSKTTTTTNTSEEVVFSLSSLDASTDYTVQASLDSTFAAGTITPDTFTTDAPPSAITSVSVGSIAYNSASATVSLSDALNTEVFLHHKVSTEADTEYVNAPSQNTSASSIGFTPGSLTAGTGYTVQTSLTSDYTSGVISATFTTPSISSMAVSDETHKSAKVTATVANMTTRTTNTTVHVRYQESGETSWMTGATGTATSADSTPEITLSGLSSGKTYTVEAAFDRNSTISVKSETFSTPGISTVAASSITHNSATVSVTVSNPNDTPIFLQYKQDSEADSEYRSAGASKTATALTPTVEFPLASLYRFTDYDVQVSFESAFPAGDFTEDKDKLFKALSTVPNKPEMLALTAGNGQFAANWNAPDDDGGSAVTGYKIQWKSGSDDYNVTDRQQTSTTTSATVTGLAKGTYYDVQVIAVNTNGDSGPSDEREVRLLDVPNAPTGVGVTRGDGGELVVSWTAPTTDALHPVDSYVVRWKSGTDDYGSPRVAEGITALTHTITGLTNGTEYTVKVNAKNTIGEGADSNEPKETPGDEPSPARNLAITPHHNELVVTWDEPSDDGGFPITGYTVQWETGGTTQEAALAAGTLMHSIQGLQSETSYTVLVISTNAIGDDIDDLDAGEVRAQITISTRPAPRVSSVDVPEGGDDVTKRTLATATVAVAHGDVRNANVVNFRYSIDSTPDGANATPVGWQSLTSQSVTVDSDLAADDTVEFNLSGLTGNTNYVVQSSLDNSFPVGEFAEDRFRTASVKPGTPTGLELVPGELSKLTLRWEAPDDGGTPITSYRVHWAFADAPSVDSGDFEVTGNPPPLSYEFATIGDQTTYEAWVFAINLHGDGPQSAVVRGMASQVPGEPSPVHVSALDSGINVRWGDAPGRGSDVTDYVIQWKKSTESLDDAQEANAEKTENGVILLFYEIMGLENGTTYDVRVIGVNSNGRGVASPWKSAIPVGSIGVPSGVTLTAGIGTIAVEWQPPNTGDTPTAYTVEWKRNSDTQWSSSPDATSPHTISGLTNGTSYNVRVFAVVGGNEGEPSTPISATPHTVPDAPSDVRINPADSSLVVSWPAPFDGGSQITGYIVQWTESGGAFDTNEDTTTSRSYTITELTNGDEYDVRVIAVNANGPSGPSSVESRTPAVPVTPPTPLLPRRLLHRLPGHLPVLSSNRAMRSYWLPGPRHRMTAARKSPDLWCSGRQEAAHSARTRVRQPTLVIPHRPD